MAFPNKVRGWLWPLFCIVVTSGLFAEQGPETLTYDEIIQLYKQDVPPPLLAAKLHRLLTTPFVNNSASDSGIKPVKPVLRQVGAVLRVAQWNIERDSSLTPSRLPLPIQRSMPR